MAYDRLWTRGWTSVVVVCLVLTTVLWSAFDVLVLTSALTTAAVVAQVLLRPEGSTRRAPRPMSREIVRAAYAAGLAVAMFGMVGLSPALVALLGLLAAVSSPVTLRLLTRRASLLTDPDPVMSWSDGQLEAAWRDARSGVGRAGCVSDIAILVDLRQRHLDELEQRDPRAFACWLDRAASYRPSPSYRAAG